MVFISGLFEIDIHFKKREYFKKYQSLIQDKLRLEIDLFQQKQLNQLALLNKNSEESSVKDYMQVLNYLRELQKKNWYRQVKDN